MEGAILKMKKIITHECRFSLTKVTTLATTILMAILCAIGGMYVYSHGIEVKTTTKLNAFEVQLKAIDVIANDIKWIKTHLERENKK
jgi:hypothetical protein